MYEAPTGLIAEQCISTRIVDEQPEARNVEIMRITPTMFVDDYGVRYSRRTFIETTIRGPEAWRLNHRNNPHALELLQQQAA